MTWEPSIGKFVEKNVIETDIQKNVEREYKHIFFLSNFIKFI